MAHAAYRTETWTTTAEGDAASLAAPPLSARVVVPAAADLDEKNRENQGSSDLLPGLISSDRRLRESALNLLRIRLAKAPSEPVCRDVLQTILALVSGEQDEHLRTKAIDLAASLARTPSVDPDVVAANLLIALQAESAAASDETFAVICERLTSAVADMLETASAPFKPDFLRVFHAVALGLAGNDGIRVRVCALRSLVRVLLYVLDDRSGQAHRSFASVQGAGSGVMPLREMQDFLIECSRVDPSCVVRRVALEGLISICARDEKFDPGSYGACTVMLKDEDDGNRMKALELLGLLNSKFPRAIVRPSPSSLASMWLSEDAFLRFCEAVTDLSPAVREAACRRLAGFAGFSVLKEDLVLQTLLKTPSAATGAGAAVQISHAAQGALTHGLEDEVQGVRMATIDAICALCRGSERFRDNARNMLVAMFTDESSAIRLKAVTSLGTIVRRSGLLVEVEQVQQMLAAVEDAHQNIRAEAYQVFGVVTASNVDCLRFLIERLFHFMIVRPEDRLLVYEALGKIGRSHFAMIGTEPMIDELFMWDRNFLPREHSTEDQFHVAKLIMLFNAACVQPAVLNMLPPYALDQYGYVRAMFGNIVPEVEAGLTKPDSFGLSRTATDQKVAVADVLARVPPKREEGGLESVEEMMAKVHQRVSGLHQLLAQGEYGETDFWIQRCRRYLQYIASTGPPLAETAGFTERYLDLCEVAIKIKSPHTAAEYKMIYNRILRTCATLRGGCVGCSESATAALVSHFRILARAVSMMYAPNRDEWTRARRDVLRMARKRARAAPPPTERAASALSALTAALGAARFEVLRGTRPLFAYMRAFAPECFPME